MSKRVLTIGLSIFISMVSFLVFKKSIKGCNVYIENIGSDIPTLNPHSCSDISSNRVMLDIYEGLVDYDQDLNIVSTGCKSYEIQNENKTFIFHLRENAKWSNGDPITADDYVYSYRRAVDPNTLAQVYIEQMYDIVNAKEIINGNVNKEELGVYADDKYTLRIELENPNSEFIYYLTLPIFLPVYRPNIEKYGISTFAKVDNIVCNGPYMMKSFIHNSHVILEKNKNYWDKDNVKIEKVKFLMIKDGTTDLNSFRTNSEHMSSYGIPDMDDEKYIKEFGSQYHINNMLCQSFLVFNLDKDKFKDVKVRKALSIALDRNKFLKVTNGKGVVSYSVIPENMSNDIYKDDIKDFDGFEWVNMSIKERNKLAQDLIRQAGYSKENPLTIELYFSSGDKNTITASAMQDIFTIAFDGLVICKLSFNDWATYLSNCKKGEYDICNMNWGADYATPSNFTMLYLSTSTHIHFKDDEFDYNYYKSMKADDADYIDFQRRCNKIATEAYATIPYKLSKRIRLVKDNVKGFKSNALDRYKTKQLSLV